MPQTQFVGRWLHAHCVVRCFRGAQASPYEPCRPASPGVELPDRVELRLQIQSVADECLRSSHHHQGNHLAPPRPSVP